jgi:L-iditol 2-dehydrogenase
MAEDTNRAVFLRGAGDLFEDEMPMPEPGPHDVLVRMKSVGVCGSDLHYYEHGRIGQFVVEEPLIIGHECAGTVVETGEEVTNLEVGDDVALEPGIPCRRCDYCWSDRYNLCRDLFFMGTPPDHGAFRDYVAWPSDFCYRLPEGVSCEVGATIEPLAVGLQAITQVGLQAGESVVVLGAGPIGLLAVAGASAFGATDITAVDLIDKRLDCAEDMGATRTVNAEEVDVAEELADSAQVVLDCVGNGQTIREGVAIARAGARVCWVGMAGETAEISLIDAQAKELRFYTVWRYAGVFQPAVNLLAAGKIDTEPIITDRFKFPNVEDALKFASENRKSALKTMINFD